MLPTLGLLVLGVVWAVCMWGQGSVRARAEREAAERGAPHAADGDEPGEVSSAVDAEKRARDQESNVVIGLVAVMVGGVVAAVLIARLHAGPGDASVTGVGLVVLGAVMGAMGWLLGFEGPRGRWAGVLGVLGFVTALIGFYLVLLVPVLAG